MKEKRKTGLLNRFGLINKNIQLVWGKIRDFANYQFLWLGFGSGISEKWYALC